MAGQRSCILIIFSLNFIQVENKKNPPWEGDSPFLDSELLEKEETLSTERGSFDAEGLHSPFFYESDFNHSKCNQCDSELVVGSFEYLEEKFEEEDYVEEEEWEDNEMDTYDFDEEEELDYLEFEEDYELEEEDYEETEEEFSEEEFEFEEKWKEESETEILEEFTEWEEMDDDEMDFDEAEKFVIHTVDEEGYYTGEVIMEGSISSNDYIKWVQRSLNRILNTNLEVDGLITNDYRQALRQFNAEYLNGRNYNDIDKRTQDRMIQVNEDTPEYMEWVQKALLAVAQGAVDLVITGVKDSNTTSLIRAFQERRSELGQDGFIGAKTELALIEESGTEPPGSPRPSGEFLDFQFEEVKTVAGLVFPKEMPKVHFPRIRTHKKSKSTDVNMVKRCWAIAHFYIWRAHQVINFIDRNKGDRTRLWKEQSSKNTIFKYSPEAWFGPYDEKRFELIKVGIRKVWNKFSEDRNKIRITCRFCKGGAIHFPVNQINLCTFWFESTATTDTNDPHDDFYRAFYIIHEIFHWIRLPNGTFITDLHSYFKNGKLTTGKIYGAHNSYDLVNPKISDSIKNERNYVVASRANENYAMFIYRLGKEIYQRKLLKFP